MHLRNRGYDEVRRHVPKAEPGRLKTESPYRHLGLFPEGPELRYLAQLVVTGGLLWFGVGLLLRMLLSLLVTLLPDRE